MFKRSQNKSKKMIDGKDELITKFVIMFCSVPYHFRLYLGGQKGRARNLSLVIKTLARTGTILSSYLRNRKKFKKTRLFAMNKVW